MSNRAALGNDRRFKVDRTIVLVLYMGALLMLPLTMLLPMPKALFVFGGEAVHKGRDAGIYDQTVIIRADTEDILGSI